MIETYWKCTEDEETSNKEQLILLLESIFHCIPYHQRHNDEQEDEVDKYEHR